MTTQEASNSQLEKSFRAKAVEAVLQGDVEALKQMQCHGLDIESV